jgi:predicted PurR-regulated permease PerM
LDEPITLTPPESRHRGQVVASVCLAAVFVALGLWTLQNFLPALAWAAIFAIALWPLYQRAAHRWPPGHHNILLPGLFTLAVALIFVVPVASVALQIGREAHGLMDWARNAEANGIPVPDAVGHLPWGSEQVTDWWRDNLGHGEVASEFLGRLDRGAAVTFSRDLGAQLARRLTLFGFTLLTLFVLLGAGQRLTEQMRCASYRAFGSRGERITRQMIASIHGTVTGLVFVGLGEGVLLGIGYVITGVPHPTILGAVSAVAAIVPFGAQVSVAVAALLLLAQGSTLAAIILLAFGLILSFCADHFVRPVLIGGATKLPFLWVLLGILGGIEEWGLLGLFVGPTIMAVLILLWREWVGAPSSPS